MSISASQSRAARELLGWTQPQLAAAASIHLSLVKNFECEYRKNRAANLLAIQRAFKRAGIIFVSGRSYLGVKVKCRRGTGCGIPVDARQSRAARELLGWSQAQLAESASIRFGTVRSFESEERELTEAKISAMHRAFEGAGIVFEKVGEFVGLKFKIPQKNKVAKTM